MKRLLSRCVLPLVVSLMANAQGLYNNATSPSEGICPLVQRDKTSLNYGTGGFAHPNSAKSDSPSNGTTMDGGTGGLVGADLTVLSSFQQGSRYFPQGERKDVSNFAAYDSKAHGTSVASLKGKVVLVGLWSTRCDPSAKMLMELATLYPKGEQFKFQVLAVNFDLNLQDAGEGAIEGGWRAINKFMIRNKQFFETSKMPVYTPGLGKEGPSNFMDIVQSLPALFVIDRTGHLAAIHLGYKDGFVGEAIKRALTERPQPVPAVAPPPAPAQ